MLVTLDLVYIGSGSSTINNHDEANQRKKVEASTTSSSTFDNLD